MRPYVGFVWLPLMAFLSLTGCSPGRNLPELPSKPVAAAYRLGPGDALDIKVLGADELNGRYTVQDDGTIRMLLIGEVPAAGLTSDQVQTEIEQKLKTGQYLTHPHASVAIANYRQFYILGEVASPGGYSYVSGMKVLSAIAAAHGYTIRPVQMRTMSSSPAMVRRIRLWQVLTLTEPDDIIRVPERYF